MKVIEIIPIINHFILLGLNPDADEVDAIEMDGNILNEEASPERLCKILTQLRLWQIQAFQDEQFGYYDREDFDDELVRSYYYWKDGELKTEGLLLQELDINEVKTVADLDIFLGHWQERRDKYKDE